MDAAVEHLSLGPEQQAALRNKTGVTRVGFAVMWCSLAWRGRLPRNQHEMPADAVAHAAANWPGGPVTVLGVPSVNAT